MKKPVASIAIYGSSATGHGYIASTPGHERMFGDGEPRSFWSASDALWHAAADLREAGVASGACEVHVHGANGSPLMALCDLAHVPSFGALKFGPGRVYVISAEEILRHASGRE